VTQPVVSVSETVPVPMAGGGAGGKFCCLGVGIVADVAAVIFGPTPKVRSHPGRASGRAYSHWRPLGSGMVTAIST
jgi:hypothetical protein